MFDVPIQNCKDGRETKSNFQTEVVEVEDVVVVEAEEVAAEKA
jgi:hypothetical protein